MYSARPFPMTSRMSLSIEGSAMYAVNRSPLSSLAYPDILAIRSEHSASMPFIWVESSQQFLHGACSYFRPFAQRTFETVADHRGHRHTAGSGRLLNLAEQRFRQFERDGRQRLACVTACRDRELKIRQAVFRVAETVQFDAHAVHDGKIEAAELAIVVALFRIVQHAAGSESSTEAPGGQDRQFR